MILPSVLTPGGGGGAVVAAGDGPTPSAFVALVAGRAGLFNATDGTRVLDFGSATAVSTDPLGVYVGAGAGCSSVLRFFHAGQSSFLDGEGPIGGHMSALAISPGGRTLAYTLGHGPDAEPGVPCGSPDLVLRDGPTGAVRRWTGEVGSGEISQLSWSADGKHLAFQTSVCCDASTTLHVLATEAAPTPVTQVPAALHGRQTCQFTLPVYSGNQLLAVRQCDGGADLVRIGLDGAVSLERKLPAGSPIALSAAGGALLLSEYGTPETPGKLLRLDEDGTATVLGTGFSQPSWAVPGSTQASPTASAAATAAPQESAAATSCVYRPSPKDAVGPAVGLPAAEPRKLPASATIHTSRGDITVDFTPERTQAPCTVNSFAHLATSKFYDGTRCHRLTTAGIYVLQCGDPSGTGSGGPGYTFADEHLPGTTYPTGTVAMANVGPDSNGSQFFLVYKTSQLGPDYTVFGHITAGLDVLTGVAAGGALPPNDGAPKLPVRIVNVALG
jgi:peptidyl-prolyl cis-trans isomerase B (cyclophilin B)